MGDKGCRGDGGGRGYGEGWEAKGVEVDGDKGCGGESDKRV